MSKGFIIRVVFGIVTNFILWHFLQPFNSVSLPDQIVFTIITAFMVVIVTNWLHRRKHARSVVSNQKSPEGKYREIA